MAEEITRTIRFKSQKTGDRQPAEMHVTTFTVQEQKIRALKTLLKFSLIAAICVLIPIAHFILVPGFLIGGIIAAKRRWDKAEEGIDASGVCPTCENHICIKLDKDAELPQWHDCPECNDPLELQAASNHEGKTDIDT